MSNLGVSVVLVEVFSQHVADVDGAMLSTSTADSNGEVASVVSFKSWQPAC